jgi:cold shock protein
MHGRRNERSDSRSGEKQTKTIVLSLESALHSRGEATRTNVSGLEATMTGTIRTLRVDKGFGFIKDDAGKEYFFHQSAVYGEGLDNLREGDSVEFDVGQGPKGPRAENVRRTST